MSRERLLRWRGVLLSAIGVVATVWLAATGRLGLYIHPRYFVFTTIMAAIALVLIVLAFALLPRAHSDDDHAHDGEVGDGHNHDHDHELPRSVRARRWWAAGSIVLIVATAAGLLVLPPATLTTSTVSQRDINGSVAAGQTETVELAGGDYSSFTVKDWAGLLRQGADERDLAGKTPTVLGFVTPDADDPDNIFYVARFVVTCCAVDAQPVGVPVYLPGWRDLFGVDEWVSASGAFAANPSIDSLQAVVLVPADVVAVDQPAEPYVY